MTARRTIRTTASVAALLLLLAACGGEEAPPPETGAAEPAPEEGEEPETEEPESSEDPEAAADFPVEDIEIISPFGGSYDLMARQFGAVWEEYLPGPGVGVNVVNVEGAGGVIGYNEAWNAEPDGYTVAIIATHSDVARYIDHEENVDFVPTEWNWVGGWFTETIGLVAADGLGIEGWQEFQEYGQSEGIVFGTPGRGSLIHAQSAIVADVLGIEASFVHYGGRDEARPALSRGEIDAYIAVGLGEWVDAGEASWIGVFTQADEFPLSPEAPTLADLELDATSLDRIAAATGSIRGLYATAGIPEDRLEILRDSFFEAAQDPAWVEFLAEQESVAEPVHGDELQTFVADLYPVLVEAFAPLFEE